MNESFRENVRQKAGIAESWLDTAYLWLVSLPAPWTVVITVIVFAAVFVLGVVVG